MKKILRNILNIFKDFVLNSFWKSGLILVIISLSMILNGVLWYLFETRIKQNDIPFIFASGLFVLNLILANYIWEREKLASFFLVSVGLFIQVLMLIFIRYLMLVF